jgi:SAM-dependent methyltransferase
LARQVSNILVNRIRDGHLRRVAAAYLTGDLLDIGCGEKQYAALVAPFVVRHVGVDHPGTLHERSNIDVYGVADRLPVADGSFGSAICTSVLEHVEEPAVAIAECYRILRPGGCAVYTVPFIWHVHEAPRDFFRFSSYGITYLFERAGFELVEVTPMSGFWVTFGQLLTYNVARFNRGMVRRLHLLDPLMLLIQGGAYLLNKIDRSTQWTWAYLVVARKA